MKRGERSKERQSRRDEEEAKKQRVAYNGSARQSCLVWTAGSAHLMATHQGTVIMNSLCGTGLGGATLYRENCC